MGYGSRSGARARMNREYTGADRHWKPVFHVKRILQPPKGAKGAERPATIDPGGVEPSGTAGAVGASSPRLFDSSSGPRDGRALDRGIDETPERSRVARPETFGPRRQAARSWKARSQPIPKPRSVASSANEPAGCARPAATSAPAAGVLTLPLPSAHSTYSGVAWSPPELVRFLHPWMGVAGAGCFT